MLFKIKHFLSANQYLISLLAILGLFIILGLYLGSLLQFHWVIWTHKNISSAHYILYPILTLLAFVIRCFYLYKNRLPLSAEKEKLLIPYRPGIIPRSDGKAFAKLFAYGTAINKGEEHLVSFIVKFNLTDKEQDVMRLLICSDATIKELSHDLMVSERVCQRHLTSIYEKTETKSRLSLLMKFYE